MSKGFPEVTEESDAAHFLSQNIHRLEMKTRLTMNEIKLLSELNAKWLALPVEERERPHA
jgi:hypothetical protein